MSSSKITSSCDKTWMSVTAICLCSFCDLGRKFGDSDVSGSC